MRSSHYRICHVQRGPRIYRGDAFLHQQLSSPEFSYASSYTLLPNISTLGGGGALDGLVSTDGATEATSSPGIHGDTITVSVTEGLSPLAFEASLDVSETTQWVTASSIDPKRRVIHLNRQSSASPTLAPSTDMSPPSDHLADSAASRAFIHQRLFVMRFLRDAIANAFNK